MGPASEKIRNTENILFNIEPRFFVERSRISFPNYSAVDRDTIDKETFRLIDGNDLFSSIDHTRTVTGSAVLFKSLIQPLKDIEKIEENN